MGVPGTDRASVTNACMGEFEAATVRSQGTPMRWYLGACRHTCTHTYTHTDVHALAVLHTRHDIPLQNAGVVCQEYQTTLAQSSMIGRKTARNVTEPAISRQSGRVRGQRMQEMMSHGLCHDLMHRNAGPACQRISNYTRPIFHDRAKNCSKRDRTDDIIMPVRQGAKAPSAAIDAPLSTARVQVWRHKWVVGIIRVYAF